MLEKKEAQYERVILVGLITRDQNEDKLTEYLDELQFLAYTAGAEVIKRFSQRLEHPDPRFFVGSGKLNEILTFVEENEIDTIIFDDELTPSQLKNIEKALNHKVIDRTQLILDIFAQRAQTSYARTQVELAQYEYLLPRLTGMWTHLERQRGGIGMRGPGETEIETDRRIVRDRISLLKDKLKAIDKQMATQRSNRGQLVRVALVGYTNVGKSTLMNALSKSEVFAEDKLFATLDTTVRKVVIGNLPFLLTDTVGFIRKLPTQLVESFKSTLDEVRESDFLVHVVDISHPGFEDHTNSVNQILSEIGCAGKPGMMVYNKVDKFSLTGNINKSKEPVPQEILERSWMSSGNHPAIFISAFDRKGIETLRFSLYQEVEKIHRTRFPYNNFLFEYYSEEE